jgi:hypothetical protein
MSTLRRDESDPDPVATVPQDIPIGCAPTEEAEFYIAWGRELQKGGFVLINDSLKQMVTLNTALLGGGIYLLKDELIVPTARILAMIPFFFSLIVAFFGMIPSRIQLDLSCPEDIKDSQEAAMKSKMLKLSVAGFLLILGLVVAAIGVILRPATSHS